MFSFSLQESSKRRVQQGEEGMKSADVLCYTDPVVLALALFRSLASHRKSVLHTTAIIPAGSFPGHLTVTDAGSLGQSLH